MKDNLQAFALKRWKDFQGFSPGQKAVTLAALAALLIGGYVLLTWKPSTTYAPLYSNLAASDASAIVSKLDTQHIPYKLSGGGAEILVPQNKVDSARLAMSSAGLPNSGQAGYTLLDKEGVTTSEFKSQVDYQRAVEGELAKTIQSIEGVNAASVHLSIPKQDVFNDDSQKPTAAVLLTVDPGTTLSDSQVQSVVNLVSFSVPGMNPDGVAVSDSNGNVLKQPGQGVGSVLGADTQAKATQAYNDQVAASIEAMLDKSLGPGHASVTVNSLLDFNQTTTTSRQYTHTAGMPPVSSSTSKEIYKGANASGGTLGSTTNTDSTGTGSSVTTGGNGSYDKSSSTVNNALGTITETTNNAPGQVKKLSVAVMIDNKVKNLDIAAMQQLVRSGVGFDPARGDTMSVQAVPFDHSAQQAATAAGKAAAAAAAAKASHNRLIGWVKQGVLVLLIAGLIIGAILASRRRNARAAKQDDEGPGPEDLDELMNDPLPAPLAPVKDLDSTVAARRRRELVEVADNRPQDVARLLSGWLSTRENER